MSGEYIVEIKSSVFGNTPLNEADFDADCHVEFKSESAAEEWVSNQIEPYLNMGTLEFHTAHQSDTSGVDAYLFLRPSLNS